jgi:hypothetical protein
MARPESINQSAIVSLVEILFQSLQDEAKVLGKDDKYIISSLRMMLGRVLPPSERISNIIDKEIEIINDRIYEEQELQRQLLETGKEYIKK